MNASTGGKTHQRPEARRLRVLSVPANGAERGLCSGAGRLPTLTGLTLKNPRRVCAPRPVPSSAHPLSRVLRHTRTATHSQRTTSPEPGGLASTSPPSPTLGSKAGDLEGAGVQAREEKPANRRGRDGAYLPWASRMAACDSAETWRPPPSPGLETWRAGTKMAAPPNFHCYFGHSSSYFLGTQLPPCDGSGGNSTGSRLRHGGGRAEGERESEGREGRVKGMGGVEVGVGGGSRPASGPCHLAPIWCHALIGSLFR